MTNLQGRVWRFFVVRNWKACAGVSIQNREVQVQVKRVFLHWFDIEKYLNRKLVLHPDDEYEVFEVDMN